MTNKKIFSYILLHLSPYKWSIGLVILALSVVSGSILSIGKAARFLIDEGLKGHDAAALNQAVVFIIILIFSLGIASFVRSYFINSIGEKVVDDIRQKVYNHLLTLKYQQLEILKVSDIVSRLSSDCDLISRIIIDTFSFCIRNSIMFVGGLILMFGVSFKLSIIVLICVPLILASLMRLGRKLRTLSRDNQAKIASLSEFIGESFGGIRDIYAANAQETKSTELSKSSSEFLQFVLMRLRLRALFFAIAITAIMCLITFVIWLGSKDVLSGELSSGGLVSFIFYAASSALSIGGMAEVFGDLQRSLAAAERVFAMMEIEDVEFNKNYPPRTNKSDDLSLSNKADLTRPSNQTPGKKAAIIFSNVTFAYPTRPEIKVLCDLSFNIQAGEFVGIVGSSGSGKSTIMQLLLRFFEPSGGSIKIFGHRIDSFSESECRAILGYASQDPFIFSGTIRQNLALGDISEEIIKTAIETTGVSSFLSQMPHGLDTQIGTRGTQVSGGQRQRIALTRALLANPEILLLDEATSALDQTSEREVLMNIRKMMPYKTIISIAHRISSVVSADRIIVINEGKAIAAGVHEELLLSCPLYQRLCSEEK
jgi:ATP-binding cassette subfamily B protein